MAEETVTVVEEEAGVKVEIAEEPKLAVKAKVDPREAQEKLTPDSPRFKEVYGQMKALERKVEDYEEKGKNTEKLMAEFKSHNERLAKAIESQVELSREAITSGKDESDEEIKQLTSYLAELKVKKVEAHKTFNYQEIADIDDEIMEAKDEIKGIKYRKGMKERDKSKEKENVEVDPAFIAFIEDTPWFNGDTADPVMIQAAYEMDNVLLRDPKWAKKPIGERLAEGGRRVEARFDWKPDKPSVKVKPPSGVEGVSGVRGTKTTTITLTPAQVAMAKGLDIPLEAYAKQVALMEGGKT